MRQRETTYDSLASASDKTEKSDIVSHQERSGDVDKCFDVGFNPVATAVTVSGRFDPFQAAGRLEMAHPKAEAVLTSTKPRKPSSVS